MALFVGRGFAAWMCAWEQVAAKPVRRRPVYTDSSAVAPDSFVLPDQMHMPMVVTLAGMVLDALRGEAA